MQVVLEKRFPVVLGNAGHFALPIEGGLLVVFTWQYSYASSDVVALTPRRAQQLMKRGCEPYELAHQAKETWAIVAVGPPTSWASIELFQYGQSIERYVGGSRAPSSKEHYLSDLWKEGRWELPVGASVLRMVMGRSIVTKIRNQMYGEVRHPKDMAVQHLQ